MKKAFAFLIIIFSLLFANNFNLALKHYKQKDYKNAYILFKKLLKSDYTSLDYNFFFGMSAVQIGKYNEAIAAFERILMYKPDNKRVKLELAKAYYLKKEYARAKSLFTEALKEIKNKKVRANIKKFLALIAQKEKKDFTTVILSAGVGYETNINSSSEHDYFPNINLPNTVKKENSKYFEDMALVNYKHIGNHIYNHNFLIYNKNVFEDVSKNISLFKYSPMITFNKFKASLGFTYLRYGGEKYLKKYELSLIKNWFTFNGGYKDYFQSKDKNKDAKFVKFIYNYAKKFEKFKAGINSYIYLQRRVRGNKTNVDYNELFVKTYVKYKKFNPFISLTVDKYLKYDPFLKGTPFNKKLTTGFVYNKPYKKYMWQFGFKFIKSISNIDVYDYHKFNGYLKILVPFKF